MLLASDGISGRFGEKEWYALAGHLVIEALALIGYLAPGDQPDGEAVDRGLFHLQGLFDEGVDKTNSQSGFVWCLAERIAPAFGFVFPPAGGKLIWAGDSLSESPSALSIIYSLPEVTDKSLRDHLLKFYEGEAQWPEDIIASRGARPTLVVNMLPRLVALALEKSQSIREFPSAEQVERLKVIIAMRNRDAQKFYNYQVSAAAEREAMAMRKAECFAFVGENPGAKE